VRRSCLASRQGQQRVDTLMRKFAASTVSISKRCTITIDVKAVAAKMDWLFGNSPSCGFEPFRRSRQL
jgi:hypothetical protein